MNVPSDKTTQSKAAGKSGDVTRRHFNHDLLSEKDDQERARQLWPKAAFLLINVELGDAFRPFERRSKAYRLRAERVGTVAVVLMIGSLLGSAAILWAGEGWNRGRPVELGIEISAIAGLLCAVLASRYGPWRRAWLRNRFMTEVLRQWHFRRCLDGSAIDAAGISKEAMERYLNERKSALDGLVYRLGGAVGQKMDQLVETGADTLGGVPTPRLPTDPEARAQLLEAYRVLRVEHQIDFAIWKASVEGVTFLGLSNVALIRLTDQVAGATLMGAMILSIVHLVAPMEWAPFVSLSLAVLGVGARAWRDGLALGEDRERYQEMRHRLELIVARWEAAFNDEKRFFAAEGVEQLAVEELRGFVRSHEKAQFLF